MTPEVRLRLRVTRWRIERRIWEARAEVIRAQLIAMRQAAP